VSKGARAGRVAVATLAALFVIAAIGCSLLTDLSGLRTNAASVEGGSAVDAPNVPVSDASDEISASARTFTRRVVVANLAQS
jgi:hypothetical protein